MSQTTKTTIAETVAAALDNDGQSFTSATGQTLHQLALAAGGSMERGTGSQHGSARYSFEDGSAIVECQCAAWDIEGSEPWSWQGAE